MLILLLKSILAKGSTAASRAKLAVRAQAEGMFGTQ